MIRVIRAFALSAALAGICGAAAAEDFPYARFQRGTLGAITAEWSASVADKTAGKSTLIIADVQSNVVHAVYRGEHRPIDAATAKFLMDFQTSQTSLRDIAGLYQEEYLFSEDGHDYWLPVQGPVAESFGMELSAGDAVDLYVIAAGGVLEPDGWKWVFAVEEFSTGN